MSVQLRIVPTNPDPSIEELESAPEVEVGGFFTTLWEAIGIPAETEWGLVGNTNPKPIVDFFADAAKVRALHATIRTACPGDYMSFRRYKGVADEVHNLALEAQRQGQKLAWA